MDEISSIDIDNEFDWMLAEYILSKKNNENDSNYSPS
jgi:CMP-N-acetylneuraminic acid synthetase